MYYHVLYNYTMSNDVVKLTVYPSSFQSLTVFIVIQRLFRSLQEKNITVD